MEESSNWVVQNLQNALATWNNKLSEIWLLITQSPEEFKDGTIWTVITNIHGALQAIGYSLLVLFFVVGVMKTCGSFAEIKRPEIALKMFIRFVLAKASIDYGLELMTSLFEIVQGIVSKIMETSGLSSTTETVLPESIIKAIEESGFWESVPLWAVTLIGSLFITVLSFIMIMTVYLVSNNHPAIIERNKFNMVQMEIARRGSKQKKSALGKTQLGKYSGKYALSELLICGECGSNYKRNGKTLKNGEHKYYWRCVTRSVNGKKICSSSGIEETVLHSAICRALNKMFDCREEVLNLLRSNLRYAITENTTSGEVFSYEKQIHNLKEESEHFMTMLNKTSGDTKRILDQIKNNFEQIKILREKLNIAKESMKSDETVNSEIERMEKMFTDANISFNEYDDVVVRRLIECIRVMKGNKIIVILKGGMQVEENLI